MGASLIGGHQASLRRRGGLFQVEDRTRAVNDAGRDEDMFVCASTARTDMVRGESENCEWV